MGHSAAGDRLSRNFSGSMAVARAALAVGRNSPVSTTVSVAGALASVSADVSFGRRKTPERRPSLAQLDGSRIPLLDAAPAHTGRLVCRPVACVVPAGQCGGRIRAGTRGPVSDFRSAKVPAIGSGIDRGLATPDRPDRQLLLLQSFDDLPLRSASRRCVFAPLAAEAAGRLFCGKRFGRSARAGRGRCGTTHISARPRWKSDAERRWRW